MGARTLGRGDVVVEHAGLRVVAPEFTSSEAARTLECSVRDALAAVAAELGDEVVLVPRLDLRLESFGSGSVPECELTAAVRHALMKRLADPGVVRYSTEAEAVASYLAALARGEQSAFPFRALRTWGGDWNSVLRLAESRGRPFLGDVLAHCWHIAGASSVQAYLDDSTALWLLRLWDEGGVPRLPLAELPADIVRIVLGVGDGSPTGTATRLVALLSAWPAARAMRVSTGDLLESQPSPTTGLNSLAGGLLYWMVVLHELGLNDKLSLAYPDGRTRRAVRWALGRTLQQGDLHPQDPVLLLFAGERAGTRVNPDAALQTAGPTPLHKLAIRLAAELELLSGELRLVELGGATVVLDRELVVDTLFGVPPAEALADVVRRYADHAGSSPASARIEAASISDLDRVHPVDIPQLPDAWRAALRALASTLLGWLVKRGHRGNATSGWQAAVEDDATVAISRRVAQRLADSAWQRAFPLRIEDELVSLRLTD